MENKYIFFTISNIFQLNGKKLIQILQPIQDNVQDKIDSENWDDYNEFEHIKSDLRSIDTSKNEITAFGFKNNEKNSGILLISKGQIVQSILETLKLDINKCVKLGPFHINKHSRGIGEKWLLTQIIPHLQKQGVKNILIKSSHPKAFSLYARLGKQIGSYTSLSDNNIHKREGRIFLINI